MAQTQSTAKPLPDGLVEMTPMEMNDVHFSRQHTVITPQLLEQMAADKTDKAASKLA